MTKFLARQKWFFDQGMLITSQVAGICQTSILIALAGDKFKYYTGLKSAWTIILLAGSGYVLGTWALGKFLDYLKFHQAYANTGNARNPVLVAAESHFNRAGGSKYENKLFHEDCKECREHAGAA